MTESINRPITEYVSPGESSGRNMREFMQGTAFKRGVIGVIPSSGRVLMVRRAPDIPKGGCWCFPGGHIEMGETDESALYREMREELGIECTSGQHLGTIAVPGGYLLEVFLTICAEPQLRPAAAEVADVRWVRHSEIATISPGLPSNATVAQMLAGCDELL